MAAASANCFERNEGVKIEAGSPIKQQVRILKWTQSGLPYDHLVAPGLFGLIHGFVCLVNQFL